MSSSRLLPWAGVLISSLVIAACQPTETVRLRGTLRVSSEYREFITSKGAMYDVADARALNAYVHDGSPYPNEWLTEVEVERVSSDMVSRGAGNHGSIKITKVLKATKKE